MKKIIFILSLLYSCFSFSEEIDPSCMQTFHVKDQQVYFDVFAGNQSCKQVEAARETLYLNHLSNFINLPNQDLYRIILNDISDLEQKIDELNAAIIEGKEELVKLRLSAVVDMQSSNANVGFTIVSCATSAGLGCGALVILALYDGYSTAQTFQSIEKAKEVVSTFRTQIVKAKNDLETKKDVLPNGVLDSIKDFNQMCFDVRNNCT